MGRYIAKKVGTALGIGLTVLSLGLLPDEVAEGITDILDDLMS
jgi:hypothetical protein